MTIVSTFLTWLVAMVLALPATQDAASRPQRFDYLVRGDFFAGIAGDDRRLARAIALCEDTLAKDPAHAEALVWHGAGLLVRAGQAFRNGDSSVGAPLFERAIAEMNRALALAPDSVGVLAPRGAVLLEATRGMPPEAARPLLESAVRNYERVLELQTPRFATIGDHAKGELLFGLAEGWSRLGDAAKARRYFERLIAEAPSSGQVPRARAWIDSGTIPISEGTRCVGCHK